MSKKRRSKVLKRIFTLVLILFVLFFTSVCIFTSFDNSNQEQGKREVLLFILDKGVDPQDFPDLDTISIHDEYYIGDHGTEIADVIREQCSKCKLISVSLGGDCDLQGEHVSGYSKISTYEVIIGLLEIDIYLDEVMDKSPDLDVVAIVNCSFGGTEYSYLEHLAIELLSERGVIIVAAAGNDASSDKHYPAAYSEVIAVASTIHSEKKAEYSNYGNWIDIAAHGYDIYASEDDVMIHGGTSISTPRVAGLIAEMCIRGSNVSIEEVIKVMKDTALPLEGDPYFEEGWLGSGVIYPDKAFDVVDPPSQMEIIRRALVSWQAILVYVALGLFLLLWSIRDVNPNN